MIGRLGIADAWMWSAWQLDRGMNFNSYLFTRDHANVAVDPLPLDDESAVQVEGLGGIGTIVLTNRDHVRAAQVLREKFAARVIAHELEAKLFDVPIDGTFKDGDEVFPGAIAIALPHGKTPGEVALHFPAVRAALVGDALIGAPAGRLSFLADEKLEDLRKLALSLRRLWGLQLDALLLCDGQPIFTGADNLLGSLLEASGDPAVNRINADELHYRFGRRDGGYGAYTGEIGLPIGARKLGYQMTKVPPGKAFCPLHWHRSEEEFFYVLEGAPSIRTLRGVVQLRKGDFIAFPTGERGVHQLRNDSNEDCLVLLVGHNATEEVCYYPDSDKLLIEGLDFSKIVRASPDLDYWDGE